MSGAGFDPNAIGQPPSPYASADWDFPGTSADTAARFQVALTDAAATSGSTPAGRTWQPKQTDRPPGPLTQTEVTQRLQHYAYVNNDPLNLTDPRELCDNPQGCGRSNGSLPGGTGALAIGATAACAAAEPCGVIELGGIAAVAAGVIILNAQTPKNPQPIANPPQPPPAIPEGWVSSPTNSGGGTIYYPPGQNPPGSGESIRVMPPGSSPVPGLEDGYWVKTNNSGQPINPATGGTGTRGETHVPRPPLTPTPGQR